MLENSLYKVKKELPTLPLRVRNHRDMLSVYSLGSLKAIRYFELRICSIELPSMTLGKIRQHVPVMSKLKRNQGEDGISRSIAGQ